MPETASDRVPPELRDYERLEHVQVTVLRKGFETIDCGFHAANAPGCCCSALPQPDVSPNPDAPQHVQVTERSALQSESEQILRDAELQAQHKGAPKVEKVLRSGDAAAIILEVANDQKADVIVMGSRGLGNLKGLLLGSVSHKVSQLSQCSCISVK
jgi:nucleotide-binding universal stress UspA family protein